MEHDTKEIMQLSITALARQLYVADLTTPNPEGGFQGTHQKSDFKIDPEGNWYQRDDGGWISCNRTYEKPTVNTCWMEPRYGLSAPPIWHSDSYGHEKRHIRECYRKAELFYSTIEELNGV